MITLDEAIKICEENVHDETYGEETRQLAEWLKELKELRVQVSMIYTACTAARAATNFAELGRMPLKSNVKTASETYFEREPYVPACKKTL